MKSSLSKIIKSKDLDKKELSNFEYEDCTPENQIEPVELYPNLDIESKQESTIGKELKNIRIDDLNKEIYEEKQMSEKMKMKAEVYLQQAKDRSEEKFLEAYNKGFEEGINAGKEAQRKVLEDYTKELSNLGNLRDDIFKKSERGIINLVLKICKKILKTELTLNPDLVRAIVKAGIERAITPGKMKLRINPEDAKFVQDNLSKIMESTEIARNILIERDETIERGSCIVTNNYGEVDARIEEQLQEIERECMKFLD